MKLQKQNVLFISRAVPHAGTENVVLQLCEIFKPIVNKIVVVSAIGFDTEKLDSLGIKHYAIPDIENKSLNNILTISKTIKNVVKTEKITVIHTHHRMAAFYVALLGLDKRCYFISTSHNTFHNKKVLTRFAYRKCNLIACGEMVKKNMTDYFGLDNVTVIHNAVKPFNDQIVIEEELKKAKEEGYFLVGNVGRLSEQKGMRYYIEAMPEVLVKHPKVKFYLIGDGEDRGELIQLCSNLKVNPVFMGFRKDVRNLMSQLDLVVLSSLWEGLPLTPIEAFSVGKTIVATGVDGTPEIVKDSENGLLVEAQNSDQLADKIMWMIEHPNEKKTMEAAAIETYKREFSFNVLANAYINYYRNLWNK